MKRLGKFSIDLYPSDLQFSVFSGEEIKRMSVVKIITGVSFDALGHALPGGLYDNLMGAHGRNMEACGTCFKLQNCPGHIGHIELNTLVYNPFFIQAVKKLCNLFCSHCYMMQLPEHIIEIVILQLKLIDSGYILEAQELELCKSDIVLREGGKFIKLENSESIPSKLAAARQLLESGQQNHVNITKTTCALRTAIVNTTLQRIQNKKCIHCGENLRNIRYLQRKLVQYMGIAELKIAFPNFKGTLGQNKVILADEMRSFLREVYKNYEQLLELLYPILKSVNKPLHDNASPVDIFFIDTLIVTPPNSRPMNVLNGRISEHHQTDLYRNIVESNNILKVIMQSIKNEGEEISDNAQTVYNSTKGSTGYEKLYNSWQELQSAINVLLDETEAKKASGNAGIKQILEKKDGLLRKHMMGKRVNYAARTVITPDPNINVEEVGVPDAFARKLSYPVPVTPWNVAELRKYVINGPDIYPGANYIQDARGSTTIIPADDPKKRQSMAKLLYNKPEKGVKTVHRHILNGDILLLNRQPSLHRPSIMAHQARILKGEKTFRLHYSNCKAYNADFDGDEMNAHIPQNEVARSEAYNLVNVARNYLVPKDGTPLGGLIQDHVIAGVKLSIRGRFFNREDYQQLVFQGLSHLNKNIKLLPPAIIKPLNLWSGKQIISTIIMNFIPEGCHAINMKSHAKIAAKHWCNADAHRSNWIIDAMSESTVIIKNGELLVGVLDKQQYGATTFGLIHCVYELYGGEVSTGLLTSLTKLFTAFLQSEGFTLGVKDILISKEADRQRHQIIKFCRNKGMAAAASALDMDDVPPLDILAEKLENAYIKDPNFRIILDRKYKHILDSYTNDINSVCLPDGLITKFPENNLQLMVLSGAKGSMVNTMQISCLLGQIELEGKRPPLMLSGKSLPSFPSFETSPKSGGFIDGRFLTGIQPQDFFFHCMAGREGLIDTAVKTSRSGYLQRCLIKHLEGLTVNYDLTVRDSDNTIVQFLYGEDGLDILKSKFFTNQFGWTFLDENSNVTLCSDELDKLKNEEEFAEIMHHNKKLHSWLKRKRKNTKSAHSKSLSAFTNFTAELDKSIEVLDPNKINKKTGRRCIDEKLVKLWKKADNETKMNYEKKYPRCPDPINSIYKPDTTFGSVSEKIQQIVSNYIKEHPERKSAISNIMYLKSTKSLAAPGESVGLLAAQSIGEPSTQMTLNTFHFAGRGEMNVTLGIPRLREILMLASANIKTPSMDIPIKPHQEKAANKLRVCLNRVTLANVLQDIQVKTQLVLEPLRYQRYELTFRLLPYSVYSDEYCVKPKQILKYIGNKFAPLLFKNILKTNKDKICIIEVGEGEKVVEGNEDDQLDYNEDNESGGAASKNAKSKSGEKQKVNPDAGDSTDDEIGEDNDATGIKLKARQLDENEYDDLVELDEFNDASDVDEVDSAFGDAIGINGEEDIIEEAEGDIIITDELVNNKMVENYLYDKESYSWAKLVFTLKMEQRLPNISNVIKDLAHKAVIHEVNNIKRAIIFTDHNGDQLLKTDGINIIEMFKYNEILDLNNLYSNDIHAMANTYGIEAAAQVIVKEIMNVFKVYGISIDRRHLSLIADYMTFTGTFQPLSRKGMEFSASPLQQMSFETCLQFLRNAAASAHGDKLLSPSSRLMVGLPVKNGTGCFDLFVKIC